MPLARREPRAVEEARGCRQEHGIQSGDNVLRTVYRRSMLVSKRPRVPSLAERSATAERRTLYFAHPRTSYCITRRFCIIAPPPGEPTRQWQSPATSRWQRAPQSAISCDGGNTRLGGQWLECNDRSPCYGQDWRNRKDTLRMKSSDD